MDHERLLPKMSSTVKAIQRELHAKNGFHMIYTGSRRTYGTYERGPVVPFKGMKISCLVYYPDEFRDWCFRIGIITTLPVFEVGYRYPYLYITTLRKVGSLDWPILKTTLPFDHPKRWGYAWFQMEIMDSTTVNGYYNNLMFRSINIFTTVGIKDYVYFHEKWSNSADVLELHWTAAKPDLIPKLFIRQLHKESELVWLYSGGLVRMKCQYSITAPGIDVNQSVKKILFSMGNVSDTGRFVGYYSTDFINFLATKHGPVEIQGLVMADHFIFLCEGKRVTMRATFMNTLSRAFFRTQNAEIFDVHVESGQAFV